jgi:hypothetical protein
MPYFPSSLLWSIVRLVKTKRTKKRRPKQPQKLRVIWETVPDPDPYALEKAFKMLFGRPSYQYWKIKPEPAQPKAGEQQQLPF